MHYPLGPHQSLGGIFLQKIFDFLVKIADAARPVDLRILIRTRPSRVRAPLI